MKKAFWKYGLLGRGHDFGMTWAEVALGEKALKEKKTYNTYHRTGTLRNGKTIHEVIKDLKESRPNCWVACHAHARFKGGSENWLIVDEDLAIDLDYTHKNRTTALHVVSLNVITMEVVRTLALRDIVKKVTKGNIYILAQANSGPYLHEMGVAGEAFEAGNYRSEVTQEYRHVIDDLNNDKPCGRVVILDGPAGTGKTHLVQAIMNEVPKGTFVLVPSNMLSSLSSPNFIRALIDEHREGHPIILIIEDADECLVNRKEATLSEISALLNSSEGIMGSVLNLRIIATTNIPFEELDSAVIRDGRLCKRIEVGLLGATQAERIYQRLTGKKLEKPLNPKDFYTLAQVYRMAKGTGSSTGPIKPKKAMGFVTIEEEPEKKDPIVLDVEPGEIVTGDQGQLSVVHEDGSLEPLDDSDLIDEDPEDDEEDED